MSGPLVRSVLYVPASRPGAVEKARGLACDVVVLDLEDAVGPDDKAAARAAAVEVIRAGGFRAPLVGARLNGVGTSWAVDDLAAMVGVSPGLVVLPKVDTPDELKPAVSALGPSTSIWAMIETPRSLFGLDAVAGALAERAGGGLMLGLNDLASALDCEPGADRTPLHAALSLTVAAARAHGLIAIDGVFNRLDDPEGLAAECAQGRRWGFDGKSLIHPSQVEAVNAAFTPSPEEVAKARAIVAAYEAREAGAGAIRHEGGMIERLHLDRARRLLALHAKAETA